MENWMIDAYYNAKATVNAFERMFELEEENEKLRAKLKEHEDRVNRMFQEQMDSMGKTMSVLIKK